MALTNEGAALTDKHRRRQVRLAIAADSQARRAWDATLDPNDLKGTQPIWRNAMLDVLQTWWNVSAKAAADYLPRFRAAEIGDGTLDVALPRLDLRQAAQGLDWLGSTNVLWHIAQGQTQQAAWQAARSLFLGVFHEMVLTGGRQTIKQWAKADPRCVGWRRVSDGDPCAFCAMLVTRGPAYTSEAKASLSARTGDKYHPHCGCTVEPVYGDWTPTKREQQWIDQYFATAESLPEGTPRTARTILPRLRRDGLFRDSTTRRSGWPKDVTPPDKKVIDHILHGEGDGKRGGHMYGSGVPGKTEFPRGWDGARIIRAVQQVMREPDWEAIPPDSRALHRFGRLIDGVQIEVGAYLKEQKYAINRAYPQGGEGVFRNTKDGRIKMPLSKGKNWRTER